MLAEGVVVGALEIQHADAAVLHQQRHCQLGPAILHPGQVARVTRHVRNIDHRLGQRGVADQPLAQLEVREPAVVAIADRELLLEQPPRFVEQKNPERAVGDDLVDERGDALEQLLEVEDRGDLAPDLGQRLERLHVGFLALEQPCVLDRHRHVRAELPQHGLVARRELADVLAVQVQRPDDALLTPERHGDLRAHLRHRADVSRVGQHVVDDQRPALGHDRADDALADGQPERPLDVLRIADGVRDAQVLSFLVEQPDGKGLERGQARDQLGDLLEQLVEVQDRGDLAAELEQRDEQLGGVGRLGGTWRGGKWRI